MDLRVVLYWDSVLIGGVGILLIFIIVCWRFTKNEGKV